MKKRIWIIISAVMLVTAIGAVTYAANLRVLSGASRDSRTEVKHLTDEEIYRELKKFAAIFEQARQHHVEPVDERKILEAAMNGMLNALDPHSSYLSADDLKEFNETSHGRFGGLGIQITADRGVIRVISPIDDTPAERAGLRAGDLITHIDGEQVGNMTLSQAVSKMKGRPGTRVRLTVMSQGREPRTITLTRAIINVKSVRFREIGPDNKIGYIRIANFGRETTRELNDAIRRLERRGMIGYVLDVRNNPGGYLTAAINVSDAFLDGGEIVSTRGRNKDEVDRTMARPGDMIKGKPIVVLINHGSASASEIVAGAIQDNQRGIVMGSKSFGKGSVQQQRPLGDGTAIHITVARYYTPSGRAIQGAGVEPDIEVLQSEVTVIERRRDMFAESTLSGSLRGDTPAKKDDDDDRPLTDEERDARDYQLNRAINMVQAMIRLQKPAPTCPADEKKTDEKNEKK
jgi:carboxyl-terminal processing protease